MKLKAGGSRLLKCELFQYQKHDQTFASLLANPWGPSRKWRSHEKWNWKEFNEGTIYKGVGRFQGATRESEAPRNSCHRRLHPRPEEMSGFAAPGSGKGSSCGRGGRIRVLWPQGRKVRAIQLHLGEEGIGKIKITNIFPTFEISLWSLLLGRPNWCWKFKWYHLRHRAGWKQVWCGFGGIPRIYTNHTWTKPMLKVLNSFQFHFSWLLHFLEGPQGFASNRCIFIGYVRDQLEPKHKIVPVFFCFLSHYT